MNSKNKWQLIAGHWARARGRASGAPLSVTHRTQCLGSQRSGHSKWMKAVPPAPGPAANGLCLVRWQPGDGGLDEVLGTARHGPWAGHLRAALCSHPGSLKPGPQSRNKAVEAAGLQEQRAASRLPSLLVCETWEMEARPAVGRTHGRRHPMYNSSQK